MAGYANAAITLADNTPTNHVYSIIGSSQANKMLRRNLTKSMETPEVLTISHQTTGKGASAVDRHLARLDVTKLDAGDGVTLATGSLHVVATVPRIQGIIDAITMKHLRSQLVAFISDDDKFTEFLNGAI